MTRILIADDSPPVRRGLRTLVGLNSDWQVCGEAVDGADAVEKAHELAPDLILMDFSMPEMDGVQAARKIAESGTDTPDSALHSESLASTHGIGSQRRFARRDVKVGNQQVAICDQGASARRDFFLFDVNGEVSSAPEVGRGG
jgi:CheY-like chemotaxis protein